MVIFVSKIDFSKSVLIDPKVSYMVRKLLRVCNSAILRDWRTFDVFVKDAQCCASVQKVQHGDFFIEMDSEQACIVKNSKRCVRGHRRVLRTLSGWPEAT